MIQIQQQIVQMMKQNCQMKQNQLLYQVPSSQDNYSITSNWEMIGLEIAQLVLSRVQQMYLFKKEFVIIRWYWICRFYRKSSRLRNIINFIHSRVMVILLISTLLIYLDNCLVFSYFSNYRLYCMAISLALSLRAHNRWKTI